MKKSKLEITKSSQLAEMTENVLYVSSPLIFIVYYYFFYLGFTALSRIFHLYRADRSSVVVENPENPGKNT